MDIHKALHSGSVEKPSVGHGCLIKLMLGVDLVYHFEDELLHHECRWISQVYPVVEVLALRLLRIPDFLRDRLAQSGVDLNVRKLQLLVDLTKVLAIDDHENVAFGEYPLAEEVVKSPITGAEWALRSLFAFQILNPLDLLLTL